ncbi:MAG: hypothetical protein ACOXZK_10355 [Bacteroidales bacterium]
MQIFRYKYSSTSGHKFWKDGSEFVTDNKSVAQGFKANWTSGELGISRLMEFMLWHFIPIQPQIC